MQQKKNRHIRGRVVRILVLLAAVLWGQQNQIAECMAQQPQPVPASSPFGMWGGMGNMWLSQFANPALIGGLYQTPNWPITGYYPMYPGGFSPVIPDDNVVLAGPVRLHPMMGVGQAYTDNVFRTTTNKQSDWFTTLAPGLQARLPFAGRHDFLVDYRTNLQYYQNNSSNDVQDQTASARFRLDFPGGLKLDFGGEHKVGHDPRGTAVDTRAFEVNKWNADSVIGQAEFTGAQSSVRMNLQSTRWHYLFRSGQDVIQDRLSNFAGMTFAHAVSPKTSMLVNAGVTQNIYDENKNLDSAIYQVSGGVKWYGSQLTSGEILIGLQHLDFTNMARNQPPPVLSQFTRAKDSNTNFFFMGNVVWTPTSLLTVNLQPYRTVQQTAVLTSLFYVSTGVNLGATHSLTDRTALTLNVGVEQDKFTSSSSLTVGQDRTDLLKNVAVGVKYRAIKWLGLSAQYMFEDRSSTQDQFKYQANTFMLSAQTVF